LSVGSTSWLANGTRASNFLPTWWKLRLSADISVELRIGPSDCEQSAEFTMFTWVGPSLPSIGSTTSRWFALSRVPNGFAPLQTFCARPSQKLRKLNTASTALGVLRPVVLRVLMRLLGSVGSGNEKTGSGMELSISTLLMFPGAVPTTPLDELLPPLLDLPLLLIFGFAGECGE